jgi:hypothetical protein
MLASLNETLSGQWIRGRDPIDLTQVSGPCCIGHLFVRIREEHHLRKESSELYIVTECDINSVGKIISNMLENWDPKLLSNLEATSKL